MRKAILGLVAALAVAFTVSSPAEAGHKRHHHHHFFGYHVSKPVVVGAVVGTVVGVGLYDGWFGSTLANTSFTTSTAGAITGGFIAGVGTVALIHAATTKCQGFHAVFAGKGCKGGKYVGR